jgi:predicted DNA-binding ribbon-helix-helix protein
LQGRQVADLLVDGFNSGILRRSLNALRSSIKTRLKVGMADRGHNLFDGFAVASRPLKFSFTVRGHRTSISLEAPFWDVLKEAAEEHHISVAALVAGIDARRGNAGLSSAVRVWALEHVRSKVHGTPPASGRRHNG